MKSFLLIGQSNMAGRGDFVSAKGLTCKNDGIHFNSNSYREFAIRYFKEFLRVEKKYENLI